MAQRAPPFHLPSHRPLQSVSLRLKWVPHALPFSGIAFVAVVAAAVVVVVLQLAAVGGIARDIEADAHSSSKRRSPP